jgi:DUF971 family protein
MSDDELGFAADDFADIEAPRTDVVAVDIKRDSHLQLEFADGVVARFDLADVRAACPCAGCRGMRERGESAFPRPGSVASISLRDAELVGAWGISLSWSDGHEAGIFPWDRLRAWHDAITDTTPDSADVAD